MSLTRGRSSLEGLLLDWSLDQPAEPSRLPVALLSRAQKTAELQRVQRRKAIDAAYEAELVLGLAADTPDRFDPPPGTPGGHKRGWAPDGELPGVSEFFTAELAVLLNCGRGTASYQASQRYHQKFGDDAQRVEQISHRHLSDLKALPPAGDDKSARR